MKLAEYARLDGLGLAHLVATKQVSPQELAATSLQAIQKANPAVNAVVETYPDRIEGLDESTLGSGPFRGVPFLMKDVAGHEAGRRCEFGSRLARGFVPDVDSNVCRLFRAAGLNILGRSAAPEYSMAGTTEGAFYGNTTNPWRKGFSAGGSTGGGMAAVSAGMVPLAHGSDIAGSIRIPASLCGGVGLKPSRGRISFGPAIDEGGFGLVQNFVQAKSVRDAAAMLDCLAVPQVGDPYRLTKPAEPYEMLMTRSPKRLRVAWSVTPLMGVATDPEIVAAVKDTAHLLASMGHAVEEADPELGDEATVRRFLDVWFFGFDARAGVHAKRTGRAIGPDTFEPMTLKIYEYARAITTEQFFAALSEVQAARRRLGQIYTRFDILLTPTTARVAEPFGRYNLGRADVTMETLVRELLAVPCQFTAPHNIMGTPAISLPLAMTADGLPIGVQLGAPSAEEHVLLALAAQLEEARPWADRVPPLAVR